MIREIRFLLPFTVSVLCLTAGEIEAERSGWSASPNTQYHIQTDEGPERYFRFQTLNGQYRKEKRLADGTVIGTEGWLDPLGYLRLKDYIADREGFRILKSKMVYVGKDRSIQDAVIDAKKVPAQSGVLATPRRPPNPFRKPIANDVTPLSGNEIGSGYYPSSTIRPRTQSVYVSPSGNNYYQSTPRPLYSASSTGLQNLDSLGQAQNRYYQSTAVPRPIQILQAPAAPYESPSSHLPPANPAYEAAQRRIAAPIARESSSDYPPYNGVHSTANGFQYYLKRQYHEEEREPSNDERIGSFGYIDPFGIRRVIYYKTDPYTGGFVHKKNNRYVGFAATPYDPLPPNLSADRAT